MIAHDREVAAELADEISAAQDGRMVAVGGCRSCSTHSFNICRICVRLLDFHDFLAPSAIGSSGAPATVNTQGRALMDFPVSKGFGSPVWQLI